MIVIAKRATYALYEKQRQHRRRAQHVTEAIDQLADRRPASGPQRPSGDPEGSQQRRRGQIEGGHQEVRVLRASDALARAEGPDDPAGHARHEQTRQVLAGDVQALGVRQTVHADDLWV